MMQPWAVAVPVVQTPVQELTLLRLIRQPPAQGRWWEVVRVKAEILGDEIRLLEPVDGSALVLRCCWAVRSRASCWTSTAEWQTSKRSRAD
ncbi:MAG: hypothetical protein R2724_12870 [Bryobacterales bacterium]